MFNTGILFLASCLPWVPEKGTVGASGDLAPLAHLALGMIGEGKMWSPESGWAEAKYVCFLSFTVSRATFTVAVISQYLCLLSAFFVLIVTIR